MNTDQAQPQQREYVEPIQTLDPNAILCSPFVDGFVVRPSKAEAMNLQRPVLRGDDDDQA